MFLASRCLSPTAVAKIKEQIDIERKALLDKKNIAEDEKMKVEKELQKRESELSKAQDEQRKLQEKLKAVESKLIVGGVNLVSFVFALFFSIYKINAIIILTLL